MPWLKHGWQKIVRRALISIIPGRIIELVQVCTTGGHLPVLVKLCIL